MEKAIHHHISNSLSCYEGHSMMARLPDVLPLTTRTFMQICLNNKPLVMIVPHLSGIVATFHNTQVSQPSSSTI
jgi:hypothetical protein